MNYKQILQVIKENKGEKAFSLLPKNSGFYIELVTEYYKDFDDDALSDNEILEHRIFEQLLMDLYYFDTRTMDALLQIADYASAGIIDSSCGVNALAAIAMKHTTNNKSQLNPQIQ